MSDSDIYVCPMCNMEVGGSHHTCHSETDEPKRCQRCAALAKVTGRLLEALRVMVVTCEDNNGSPTWRAVRDAKDELTRARAAIAAYEGGKS